jgi:hypothetical protein
LGPVEISHGPFSLGPGAVEIFTFDLRDLPEAYGGIQPGEYTVVVAEFFWRGSKPDEPDRQVSAESNKVTIKVVPAD